MADLVREECRTAMIHHDMTLSRLMMYAQSIEESKFRRMTRSLKTSGSSDQDQFRFKKRAQTQDGPISKVKLEKGGGSQSVKPTCATCGKKHYGKCLRGTDSCYGCVKEGHKVRECPIIAAIGRESKQVAPSAPKDDAPTKRRFYELRTREEKLGNGDDDEGKSLHFSLSDMSSF